MKAWGWGRGEEKEMGEKGIYIYIYITLNKDMKKGPPAQELSHFLFAVSLPALEDRDFNLY